MTRRWVIAAVLMMAVGCGGDDEDAGPLAPSPIVMDSAGAPPVASSSHAPAAGSLDGGGNTMTLRDMDRGGARLATQGSATSPKRHRCRVTAASADEAVTCHVREGAHIDYTDSTGARHYHTFTDDNTVRGDRTHTLFAAAEPSVTVHEYEDDKHVARGQWKGGRHVRTEHTRVSLSFSVGATRTWRFPRAKAIS